MKRTIGIAISNQKGGVGKTTTAISLAAGLAGRGKRVLLVDLDPQGHCAYSLGLQPEPGAFYLLTMGQTTSERDFILQFIKPTGRENLWLLPGNSSTMTAQTIINAEARPISCIQESIASLASENFQFILFDTAPSVGGIQERAIWAADLAIVPTSTEYLSTESVRRTIDLLLHLQKELAWKGKLFGILPTFYYQRLREHRAAMNDLLRGFGDLLLPPIHRSALLSECPGEAKTVFEKNRHSRSAQEYSRLMDLILRIC